MYETKIRPFNTDDFYKESRGRVESGDTGMETGGRSREVGLNSSKLFGPDGEEGCCSTQAITVRPDGVRVCSYCSLEIPESAARENIRSFIDLPVPILNPVLIGTNGKLLAKILNIKEGLMKDIIECKQVMRRSDNEYVKASAVATCQAGDFMIHGEIIDHLFDHMHIDRSLNEEFYAILEKIKPVGDNPPDNFVEYATIGDNTIEYYADDEADEAETQAKLTHEIETQLLNPFSRLTLLANADHRAIYNMLMRNIRVMPAGIRPVIDKRQDPITDLYREVIEESEKVHILSAQDDIQKVCQRIRALVLAVRNLFIGIRNDPKSKGFLERLQHKEGHIRDKMLGKRINYSGRSVIVVDPTLDLNECSIPKEMALRIFSYHINRFKEVESMSGSNHAMSDLEILEKRVIPHIPILLNRAPTLHRLSFLAYMVKLSDNMAIGLHPLACSGFNADFDGDTMAAHVPLSDDAVMEAVTLLAATSNAYIPANGQSTFLPRQEAVYGLHFLTKERNGFSDPDNRCFTTLPEIYEAVKLHSIHAHTMVSFAGVTDTAGRFAVWSCLPKAYRKQMLEKAADGTTGLPVVTKKVLNDLVTNLHKVKTSEFKRHLNKLLEIAFVAATLYAPTLNTLVVLPSSLKQSVASFDKTVADLVNDYADGFIKEDEFNSSYLSTFNTMMSGLGKTVIREIDDVSPNNGYCSLVTSGAKGDASNLLQMFVCKGQVRRAGGAFNAVIRSSLCDQMTGLEQFVAASGTRASMMDKSNKPSDTGDLWRRLNYACASVVIRTADCGANEGLLISKTKLAEYLGTGKNVDALFMEIIKGRYTTRVENRSIDEHLAEEIAYGLKDAEGNFIIRPIDAVTTNDGVVMRKDYPSNTDYYQALVGKTQMGHPDTFVTAEAAEQLSERESVMIRSPLKCAHHVCAKCYGINLVNNKDVSIGTPVGFIAAQSIGEPATQLTMRTFHKGGVVGGADIVSAFDRFERLCEVTDLNPKKCATYDPIAWATGQVMYQEIGMKKRITIGDNPKSMFVPLHARLKNYVTRGEGLGEESGDKDIKELMEYAGFDHAVDYLLYMLFLAYHGQVVLNIKHFEILTSSMIREWIVDSVNPDYKVGTHMTIYERQMVADGIRTVRVILGLKKIPRNTIHPFENFAFQYLGDGISSSSIRGSSDKVTAPYARIMMGLPPTVGTHYANYLADEQLAGQSFEVI